MSHDEMIDHDELFRAERDGSTRQPTADFDHVLREFKSIARLIASMPADERAELRNRLDQAMARNDQLSALSDLMVSIALPQAVQS
jgi:hypothetical protein